MRTLALLLIFALCAWLLWLVFLLLNQQRILYPGAAGLTVPVLIEPPQDAEVFFFAHEEGHSEAWFLPAIDVEGPAPMVVFAHGNGERIEHWAEGLRPWREMGFHLLLPEYRGFGRSTGTPREASIVADVTGIVREFQSRPEVDPERLVFHGRSLGTGVLAAASRHTRPDALVLESGFSSLREMASPWLVPSFLLRDRYETRRHLAALRAPVLVLHGERDELVPPRHAERLAGAVPGTELIFMNCGHNDCPGDVARYWSSIRAFLARNGLLPEGPPARDEDG